MSGLPKSLQNDDVFVSLMENGEMSLTDVISPAFTIPRPHSDGCLSATIVASCLLGKGIVANQGQAGQDGVRGK
jgi:hypothetical protein